jgi:hypothetical protein
MLLSPKLEKQHIRWQRNDPPLQRGCDLLALPNLVQQQIAHFHVCTFFPTFPKEGVSQDMHT